MPCRPVRTALVTLLALSLWPVALSLAQVPRTNPPLADQGRLPVTGEADDGLQHLDRVMRETLEKRGIPGAQLAIAKDGKLILARGYGLADVAAGEAVQPTALFNLASCSKPFASVAILQLVDEGKLRLDDRAFRLLPQLKPPPGARVDPRVNDITLRELLQHTSGLERKPFGKLKFRSLDEYVGRCLARPLLFAPGTDARYSNLGFLIPRLVVRQVTGEDFGRYVREQVLRPMGIRDMVVAANEEYVPGEVRRYSAGGRRPITAQPVLIPGAGCWRASAVDVVRFLTGLDGSRGKPLLSAQAMKEMLAMPPSSVPPRKNGSHFGLGWDGVQATPDGPLYHKNGGLPGISTFMEHLPNGVDWAVCFNGSRAEEDDENPEEKGPPYKAIKEAVEHTDRWPGGPDLFAKYQSAVPAERRPGRR
jgi:N-acyl-D-amino-acid deacylase